MPVLFSSYDESLAESGLDRVMTRAVEEVLKRAGLPWAEVSLSVVDDEVIRRLNREFRSVDKPTDVLSFPQFEQGEISAMVDPEKGVVTEEVLLGDVIISLPRAREQASDFGHSLDRELAFLAVHGALHLLGYDHDTVEGEARMMAETEAILAGLGLSR